MLKLFKILCISLCSLNLAYAEIDVDNSPQGETRIIHSADDFDIKIQLHSSEEINIQTLIDPFSFDWVRVHEFLLAPRARLKIKVPKQAETLALKYKDKIINFQGKKENAFTELFVSLYEKNPIEIFHAQKLFATLTLVPKKLDKPKILVDYTCSRNNIIVDGLTSEHISIGCHTKRIGKFGKEKPMLEIMWVSPELQVLENEVVPYNAVFLTQSPVKIQVKNIYTNEIKTISIAAVVPKRLHRMFTAYGFGPYALNTKTTDINGNELVNQEPMVPALFFYMNYKISETASIRGFDAAVFKKSNFNNAGIYLGNDFGFSLDNKLYFTTLIGLQYLYFKFDEDNPDVSEAIFPQGIEFMYRHAFGIPNYIISGGVFLSTTDAIEYENAWIRWGKNYFWELNLISWAKEDFEAKTWGISVGFPFKGFL